MKFNKRQISIFIETFLVSALLLSGNYYLSHRADNEQNNSNLKSVAALSVASPTAESSNDVSPKKSHPLHNTIWLVAIDIVNSFGNSINQKSYPAPGLARLSPILSFDYFTRSIQTTSQVDTKLGQLFTLVGEHPSGTS